MHIWHSLICQQIDMLTAGRLVSIFRNNAGTPLSTLRSNTATLKYDSTFPRGNFNAFSTCVTESKLFGRRSEGAIETWLRFKQKKI